MDPRQSVASTGSSSTQRQTAKLTLSQLITAHNDAAAQPNPCPTHTQNISSSNLLSFQRKNIRGGGPAEPSLFHMPTPYPPSRRSTSYRGTTGELSSFYSQVAFNDIKHLTRSMPA